MAAALSSLPPLPSTNPPPTQTPSYTEQYLISALKSPHSPPHLRALHALHAHAIKTGHARSDPVLAALLLRSPPHHALALFLSLPDPSPSLHAALIKSLSSSGSHLDALRAFAWDSPLSPFTLPHVLRSAAQLQNASVGAQAHALAIKTRLHANLAVATALVYMYCFLALPHLAMKVFDGMVERDVILYNTTMAGFVKCREFGLAREMFDEMYERNVSSWNTIVDMYCKAGDSTNARRLFDEMPERDIVSWNTMISGYAKVGDADAARELFDWMPERNVISWNAVITCYVHNRRFSDALDLFRMMQASDVRPDEVTIAAVLPACAHLGTLDIGKWVHGYIRRKRIKMDVHVATALINMYGNCGSIDDAWRVFYDAVNKDAFLCGTMIEVLAMHGQAVEAFEVFDCMRHEGIKPNDVTFVGLLKSCSHVGLVESGLQYFDMMCQEFGLVPKVEHFGCMVDLLGRARRLEEAHELILSMPMEPPPVVWASLLSSCRIHGNVRLAEEVAFRLIELEPKSCGNYVQLSNIYSNSNLLEEAANVRKMMKEKGVVKKPGCSLIEVNDGVHEFFAGDRDHPCRKEIYDTLDQMAVRLKKEGYMPWTSTLHDVDRDRREQAVLHHSEKLALAFGLMTSEKGATVRIAKNLRVCDDCHSFMKLASKIYDRQVILRDRHRFHHFHDGVCSCSDYW